MLLSPKYSKYERPGDFTPEDPLVLVRKNVIRDLGMPEVNYEGIHTLLHEDMGIPEKSNPRIKLFGGSLPKRAVRQLTAEQVSPDMGALGFHVPYTRTIHVNASAAERGAKPTMKVLVHEARHMKDSQNHRLLTAADIAARLVIMKTAAEVADLTDITSEGLAAVVARLGWYHFEPCEARANEAMNSELYYNHAQDIVFPERSRDRWDRY